MTTPFDGLQVWGWTLANMSGGDPAAIVAQLNAVGASGLLLKAVDDTGEGPNKRQAVRAVRDAVKAAGLTFTAWGYNYGSNPAGEAAAAVQAIHDLEPDAYVFDVEAEFEGLARPDLAATAIVRAVQAGAPNTPLAYSPLPAISQHLRLPYYQFSVAAAIPMMPQFYYVALGNGGWTPQYTFNQFYAAAHEYGLDGPPICPAWEDAPLAGAASTTEDVIAFVALARYCGNPGISVWAYDHLDAAGWSRVALAARLFGTTSDADLQAQITALSGENVALKSRISGGLLAAKSTVEALS